MHFPLSIQFNTKYHNQTRMRKRSNLEVKITISNKYKYNINLMSHNMTNNQTL